MDGEVGEVEEGRCVQDDLWYRLLDHRWGGTGRWAGGGQEPEIGTSSSSSTPLRRLYQLKMALNGLVDLSQPSLYVATAYIVFVRSASPNLPDSSDSSPSPRTLSSGTP